MLSPAFGTLTSVCLPDFWLEYGSFAGLFAMVAVLFTQFVQTMAVSYLHDYDPNANGANQATGKAEAMGKMEMGPEMEKVMVGGETVHRHSHAHDETRECSGTLIVDDLTPAEHDISTHATTPGHAHDHGHDTSLSSPPLGDHEHTYQLLFAHRQRRKVTVYVLEVGIATHSFIIGMALGVSTGSALVALMCALAFHQFFGKCRQAKMRVEWISR